MSVLRRGVVVGLTAGLLVVAGGGVAVADPKGETFQLNCGNAGTFTVITPPGNGEFTPALDADSNKVLVPVSFGAFTGTITKVGGSFSETFTDPPVTKGSGKQTNLVSCSFTFQDTFTLTAAEAAEEGLPGAGTYTFTGSGTVRGLVKGR